MCIWCKLCVFMVPSFRCKSGVWVNSVYKVYILSCNFGVPRVSCTWYKLRIFVVPSSKCILLLHIGIFAMYFTLRTLPIPRGLHQSGTCKRGVVMNAGFSKARFTRIFQLDLFHDAKRKWRHRAAVTNTIHFPFFKTNNLITIEMI